MISLHYTIFEMHYCVFLALRDDFILAVHKIGLYAYTNIVKL